MFRYRVWFSLSAFLFCGLAQAQFLQRELDVAKRLPDSERNAVARLENLSHLPPGQWRYHVGDLAHGEEPGLDDSSWPVAKPDSTYPEQALWFRQWVEVPKNLDGYDLTGTRIWFRFQASMPTGRMPQIIYFNGRRVAMGDDLEPIVLFDQARPGDKVMVAVKLLPTVDKKHFAEARLAIDFLLRTDPSPRIMRRGIFVGGGAGPEPVEGSPRPNRRRWIRRSGRWI